MDKIQDITIDLDKKVNKYFAGRAVRKDLTKKMKQGFNVAIYVLEYLLGMYCATDDEETLNDGIERVRFFATSCERIGEQKL